MTGTRPFAAVRETHSGVVFLVGDRAYKLKKPVDMDFLGFSTPERRLAACRREVELNRRLAPDVYLGAATASDVDHEEPLVVMRRMPEERRLSTLARSDVPPHDAITRLARVLASFHAGAQRGPHVDAEGTPEALAARWEASFAQVDEVGADTVPAGLRAEITWRTRTFLAGRDALFMSRISGGRIVDGHGDLLADELGAVLLSSDRLRKELEGLDPTQHAAAPYRSGIYIREHTDRAYAELLRRAEELLSRGESVVLDASWSAAGEREAAGKVADRTHGTLVALRCVTPPPVAAARLRTRTGALSAADPEVARAMATDAEPWPQAATVDTSGTPAAALAEALRPVRAH